MSICLNILIAKSTYYNSMSKRLRQEPVTYKSKRSKKKPYIHNSLLLTLPKKKPEEDDGLIDISLTRPRSETLTENNASKSTAKPNFEDIDRLLEEETKSASSSPAKASYSTLPSSILEGTLDSENPVKEKYKNRRFPLPSSQKALKARVKKLLPVIPRILAGDEELSFYYTLALEQRKELPNRTMSSSEQENTEWKRYIGGFYGLKRQHFVSRMVLAKYSEELKKLTNKTIVYWTPETFSTYVLANEIILRIVAEDEKLLFAKAEKLLKDTIDYGCYVADEVEFEDDIEFGDVLGKEKKKKEKKSEKKRD